jgi:hypothetical protein
MATKNEIYVCNLAQEKLGADRLSGTSLNPSGDTNHKRYELLYPHWRDIELKKRRWAFATDFVDCTYSGTTSDPDYPYNHTLPAGYSKPWRTKFSDWQWRQGKIWSRSAEPPTGIQATKAITDVALMDDEFVAVVAARLALESYDKVTQKGSTKYEELKDGYNEAVREAARVNAFHKPADDISDDDTDFSWVSERAHGG